MRTPSAHCVHGRDHEDAKDQVAFSLGRYLFRVGMKGIPRRVEICLFSPVVCVCVLFFFTVWYNLSPRLFSTIHISPRSYAPWEDHFKYGPRGNNWKLTWCTHMLLKYCNWENVEIDGIGQVDKKTNTKKLSNVLCICVSSKDVERNPKTIAQRRLWPSPHQCRAVFIRRQWILKLSPVDENLTCSCSN